VTVPSSVRRVFVGPVGLRAGWSLLLYVALFALVAAALALAVRSLHVGEPWLLVPAELGALVSAFSSALVLARMEGRPWGAYGLPARRGIVGGIARGAIWGFLSITLLLLCLYLTHAFTFRHVVLPIGPLAGFGAFWGVFFLLVGLFEEFLLRGYAQFTLARGIGFWPAALLLSCVFGAIHLHNPGEGWTGALAAVLIGLFLCYTLRRTGDLWFAVGFHSAWDWGESFIYSAPDSGVVSPGHLLSSSFHGPAWLTGGATGPEGSVLCLLVIGAVWAAFARTHK